ncbi:TPA: hypothetical protein ACJ2WV_000429 [Kluyvera georgiana]
MPNYAIVENGKVIDLSVWDGNSDWRPEIGEAILASEGVSIGWSYSDGVFTAPYIPSTDDENQDLEVDSETD